MAGFNSTYRPDTSGVIIGTVGTHEAITARQFVGHFHSGSYTRTVVGNTDRKDHVFTHIWCCVIYRFDQTQVDYRTWVRLGIVFVVLTLISIIVIRRRIYIFFVGGSDFGYVEVVAVGQYCSGDVQRRAATDADRADRPDTGVCIVSTISTYKLVAARQVVRYRYASGDTRAGIFNRDCEYYVLAYIRSGIIHYFIQTQVNDRIRVRLRIVFIIFTLITVVIIRCRVRIIFVSGGHFGHVEVVAISQYCSGDVQRRAAANADRTDRPDAGVRVVSTVGAYKLVAARQVVRYRYASGDTRAGIFNRDCEYYVLAYIRSGVIHYFIQTQVNDRIRVRLGIVFVVFTLIAVVIIRCRVRIILVGSSDFGYVEVVAVRQYRSGDVQRRAATNTDRADRPDAGVRVVSAVGANKLIATRQVVRYRYASGDTRSGILYRNREYYVLAYIRRSIVYHFSQTQVDDRIRIHFSIITVIFIIGILRSVVVDRANIAITIGVRSVARCGIYILFISIRYFGQVHIVPTCQYSSRDFKAYGLTGGNSTYVPDTGSIIVIAIVTYIAVAIRQVVRYCNSCGPAGAVVGYTDREDHIFSHIQVAVIYSLDQFEIDHRPRVYFGIITIVLIIRVP